MLNYSTQVVTYEEKMKDATHFLARFDQMRSFLTSKENLLLENSGVMKLRNKLSLALKNRD